MISITLSKRGNGRFLTQHSEMNHWPLQPMVIPKCARCTGMFIFWKTLSERTMILSITGVHLPPGSAKYLKKTRNNFFKDLLEDVPNGTPYYAVVCGGKIDTPQNKFLYHNSLRHYIYPLQEKYPDIPIVIFPPTDTTAYTTLFLAKDGTVDASMRHYAT